MPDKQTIENARRDAREGKAPSTQAGEFVKEEMDHIREGKHGARSTKQAIAIGLSKARRAGVQTARPGEGDGLFRDAAEGTAGLGEIFGLRRVRAPLPGDDPGLEAGRQQGGVPSCPCPAGAPGSPEEERGLPQRRRPQGVADASASGSLIANS